MVHYELQQYTLAELIDIINNPGGGDPEECATTVAPMIY